MRLVIAAAALAFGLAGAALVASGVGAAPPAPYAAIPAAAWQPRAGDVILRASRDAIGSQIRSVSGDGAIYSHVGLVVDRGGQPAVIDASPFGSGLVGYKDVTAFTTDGETSELLILRPTVPFDAGRLSAQASRLAAAGIAFDTDLDADDTSRFYCSELVRDLLADAGIDLRGLRRTVFELPLAGPRLIIPPDAFAHAPGFVSVYHRPASS